jgi:hypothetical protein
VRQARCLNNQAVQCYLRIPGIDDLHGLIERQLDFPGIDGLSAVVGHADVDVKTSVPNVEVDDGTA